MYQYKFSLYNYSSSNSYIFGHESKFTEAEFNAKCDECIFNAVKEYIETIKFDVYSPKDRSLFTIENSPDYGLELRGDYMFLSIETHIKSIIKLMESNGFIHIIPSYQGIFNENIYSYISHKFTPEVDECIMSVIKRDDVSIIDSLTDLNDSGDLDKLIHASDSIETLRLKLKGFRDESK